MNHKSNPYLKTNQKIKRFGINFLILISLSFIYFLFIQSFNLLNPKDWNIKRSMFNENICQQKRITVGGPYIEKKEVHYLKTNQGKEKIELIYYNTETEFIIKIKSESGWNDLLMNGSDIWTNVPVAPNTWGVYTMPLPIEWTACQLFEADLKIYTSQSSEEFKLKYHLIGLQQEENELLGHSIQTKNQTKVQYTFFAKKDIPTFRIEGIILNVQNENPQLHVTGCNIKATEIATMNRNNKNISILGSIKKGEKLKVNVKWKHSSTRNQVMCGTWSIVDQGNNLLAKSVKAL